MEPLIWPQQHHDLTGPEIRSYIQWSQGRARNEKERSLFVVRSLDNFDKAPIGVIFTNTFIRTRRSLFLGYLVSNSRHRYFRLCILLNTAQVQESPNRKGISMVHFRTDVWTITPAGPELRFTGSMAVLHIPRHTVGRFVGRVGDVFSPPLIQSFKNKPQASPVGNVFVLPDFQQRGEQTCPTAI
jgi:hypothetical protein